MKHELHKGLEEMGVEERSGLSRRLESYESEQVRHSDQIGQLTTAVAALTADVRSLVDSHKVLAESVNRPFAWGTLISVGALVVMLAAAVIAPIRAEIGILREDSLRRWEQVIQRSDYFEARMNEVEVLSAISAENRRWLEKVEERDIEQIQELWRTVEQHHYGGARNAADERNQ